MKKPFRNVDAEGCTQRKREPQREILNRDGGASANERMQMRSKMEWRDTASTRSSSLRNRTATGLTIAQDPGGM